MENGEASRDAGTAAAGPARQWEAGDYLAFVVEQIHSVVAAMVDDDGLPVTCVIDMMDSDGDGLYFLTARGKNFYDRLVRRGYMALSGKKGADTMSCTAVSVRGASMPRTHLACGVLPARAKGYRAVSTAQISAYLSRAARAGSMGPSTGGGQRRAAQRIRRSPWRTSSRF